MASLITNLGSPRNLPTTSPKEHEKDWPLEPQMRQELLLLGKDLKQYATALAEIVGIEE
jgi:hypothetical protein